MLSMRLNSIIANRHIFKDEVSGKPLRFLLNFETDRRLRLQVAGDGEQMIADDGALDAPFENDEYGGVDVADVTETLFAGLYGLEVIDIQALRWNGRLVGVKLNAVGDYAFHFWVDGDDLHWGDEAALIEHEWIDGIVPAPSEYLQI